MIWYNVFISYSVFQEAVLIFLIQARPLTHGARVCRE